MLEDGVSRYAETRGVGKMKPVEDTRPRGDFLGKGSCKVEIARIRASYSVVQGCLALLLLVVLGLRRGLSQVSGLC